MHPCLASSCCIAISSTGVRGSRIGSLRFAVRDDTGEVRLSIRHAAPPVLFGRRRVRLSCRCPSHQSEGGGAPSGAPFDVHAWTDPLARGPIRTCRALYLKRARLSALLPRRSIGSGPRFSAGNCPERQRAPRSQAVVPGGRCPGTARVRKATLAPRPQVPHPAAAGFLRNSRRKANRSLPGPTFPARSASERLRRRPSRARTRIEYSRDRIFVNCPARAAASGILNWKAAP